MPRFKMETSTFEDAYALKYGWIVQTKDIYFKVIESKKHSKYFI